MLVLEIIALEFEALKDSKIGMLSSMIYSKIMKNLVVFFFQKFTSHRFPRKFLRVKEMLREDKRRRKRQGIKEFVSGLNLLLIAKRESFSSDLVVIIFFFLIKKLNEMKCRAGVDLEMR